MSIFFPVFTQPLPPLKPEPWGYGKEGSGAYEMTMLYLGLMLGQNSELQPRAWRPRPLGHIKWDGQGWLFGPQNANDPLNLCPPRTVSRTSQVPCSNTVRTTKTTVVSSLRRRLSTLSMTSLELVGFTFLPLHLSTAIHPYPTYQLTHQPGQVI